MGADVASAYPVLLVFSFFLGVVALEWMIGFILGRRLFEFRDSLSSMSCGMGQQLVDTLLRGVLLWAYVFVHDRWALFDVRPGVIGLVGLFVVTDLLHYAFHRASHRVNILWAFHVPHHSSEEFNYSVALRPAWFHKLAAFPIYLFPAFLGFSPKAALIITAVHATTQFWTHTRLLRKEVPYLRHLLVTPSHHRVHHGSDEKYRDRNYAAFFSVWDRLFGSYTQEEETPTFGITTPLGSYNAGWANVHYFVYLYQVCRRLTGLRAKLRFLLAPPEYLPPGIDKADVLPAAPVLARKRASRAEVLVTLAVFVPVVVATGLVLRHFAAFSPLEALVLVIVLLGAMSLLGMASDRLASVFDAVRREEAVFLRRQARSRDEYAGELHVPPLDAVAR